MGRIGRSLGQSVDAYNSAVGSLERQVLPGARKFTELGLRPGREIEEILPGREARARAATAPRETASMSEPDPRHYAAAPGRARRTASSW